MPSFEIIGISGADVGADTARATVEKRIDAEVRHAIETGPVSYRFHGISVNGYSECVRRVADQIAVEVKDAGAAVDATAAGSKGESRVMVAYMTATNNQNAIREIQRERAGA
jgi:hypothetical protein